MADTKAPRPPTVTAVAASGPPAAQAIPTISLPPETIARWQQIVRQALNGGRDISALVQQYAEQSFNTKLGSLDTQGARRRMLARAHAALERERSRAEGHLQAQPAVKPPIMTRSFQANTLNIPGPQDVPPPPPLGRSEKKIDIEWHHTSKPVDDPYTKRTELEAQIRRLTEQMQAIDKELPIIDAVLNRGLRNQQNVVTELAAVSRELYRLAQEVRASIPAKTTPQDGSGYQKSARKKKEALSTQSPESQGPSQPVTEAAANADVVSASTPPKSVPINPLVPAAKQLGRILGQISAKTGQIVGAVLNPVASAIVKAATAAGSLLSAVFGGVGRVLSSVGQTIADAWPWRGPPPQ